jgi:hypothetical protein
MAGPWESWNDPVTCQPLETYTIITTDPNEVMEPIPPECLSSCAKRTTRGGWSHWTLLGHPQTY